MAVAATSPTRIVCLHGARRFWVGFALVAMGLVSGGAIALMSTFVEGPNAVPQDEMLTAAAATALGLGLPGAFLMLFAPRVRVDLIGRTVRAPGGERLDLVDVVCVLREQTELKVQRGGQTLETVTNYVMLLLRGDDKQVLALDASLERGTHAGLAAVHALFQAGAPADALFLLEECSDRRAEQLLEIFEAAGFPAATRLADGEVLLTGPTD